MEISGTYFLVAMTTVSNVIRNLLVNLMFMVHNILPNIDNITKAKSVNETVHASQAFFKANDGKPFYSRLCWYT